jgi:hypothetical protein
MAALIPQDSQPEVTEPSPHNPFAEITTTLYQQIIQVLKEHLDTVDERYYDLIACYVLMTRRYQHFESLGYLHFNGPPGSGKTRALELVAELTEETPILASAITPAALFHLVHDKQPSFVAFDEFDRTPRDYVNEFTQLLNAGYRKGLKAFRSVYSEQGKKWETQAFDVYCPKGIATVSQLTDTLASRCLRIPMSRTTKPEIRFRLDHEKISQVRQQLGEYKFLCFDKKPFPHESWGNMRIAELFEPLYQCAPTTEIEQVLNELANEMSQIVKAQEAESPQGFVIQLVHDQIGEATSLDGAGEINVKVRDLRNQAVAKLADMKNEQAYWTERRITGILKTVGFTPRHTRTSRQWTIPNDKLSKLYDRYPPVTEA